MNRHASFSPRNSHNTGFIPLGGRASNTDNNNDMEGIQLTPVKSHASAASGHRKADNARTSFDASPEAQYQGEDEKADDVHRGRRRKLGEGHLTRSSTGEGASLNAMGRMYDKIINFSVVTRYLVYVLPVGILLAIPPIVLAALGKKDDIPIGTPDQSKDDNGNQYKGPALFKIFMWIEIMWLSCWIAKVVAWFLPKIFLFVVGVVSMGTRKYATVLTNLILPFSFFFWALASYVTFKGLYREGLKYNVHWVNVMDKILGSLFVSSAVFLGEKAIVQLIGISYHQRSFANRIKASKHEVRLLGLLYDASRALFPMYSPEFAEEDYVINDSIEMKLRGKKGNRKSKNGAATPMKLIGDVARVGDKVTSVFGNLASEITGKNVFNPNSAHSIVLEALEKPKSSEALGRRIWMSFVVEGNNVLLLEDFQEVLGASYKTEAEECFWMIDGDENGDISLDEMVRKISDIGKERKDIGEGMKDIGQALQAFDKILLFVVLLIVIFVFRKYSTCSFLLPKAKPPSSCILQQQLYPDIDHCRYNPSLSLIHFRCYRPRVPRFLYLLVCQASFRCW